MAPPATAPLSGLRLVIPGGRLAVDEKVHGTDAVRRIVAVQGDGIAQAAVAHGGHGDLEGAGRGGGDRAASDTHRRSARRSRIGQVARIGGHACSRDVQRAGRQQGAGHTQIGDVDGGVRVGDGELQREVVVHIEGARRGGNRKGRGQDALGHRKALLSLGCGIIVGIARLVGVDRAGSGAGEADHSGRNRTDAAAARVDTEDHGQTRGRRSADGIGSPPALGRSRRRRGEADRLRPPGDGDGARGSGDRAGGGVGRGDRPAARRAERDRRRPDAVGQCEVRRQRRRPVRGRQADRARIVGGRVVVRVNCRNRDADRGATDLGRRRRRNPERRRGSRRHSQGRAGHSDRAAALRTKEQGIAEVGEGFCARLRRRDRQGERTGRADGNRGPGRAPRRTPGREGTGAATGDRAGSRRRHPGR